MKKALVVGIVFLFIGVANPLTNDAKILIASEKTNTLYTSIIPPNNGTLSGYVTDTAMNPIEGAKVTVYFHNTSRENYSDSTGYYHVTDIPICWCMKNATCAKEGYFPEWALLAIYENTTHDFVLSPKGQWLYVGGSGPGNYTTIQEAIDDANPDDTVFVYSGTYFEVLIVNKTIGLIGENRDTTVIDGGWGIYVVDVSSDGVTMSGFTILNGYYGIFLDSSSDNTLMDNNAHSNNYCGIFLESSSNNTIMRNNAINTQYGIHLSSSSNNNNFHHNNIINNTQNAYDDGSNIWDNGYPSGGNYWSDYNGTDSDGDGIGDTPYNIPGGSNQDYYPFMEPNGWMNQPPVAHFTAIVDGLSAIFNGTTSYDPDGTITTWLWDFGDGVEGTGEIVNHDFQTSGKYNITITVIDDDGAEDSYTQEILIRAYTKAIIFGRIFNLTTEGVTITFNTINIRIITFNPFAWVPYTSGEKIIIAQGYSGFIGYRYVLTLCRIQI